MLCLVTLLGRGSVLGQAAQCTPQLSGIMDTLLVFTLLASSLYCVRAVVAQSLDFRVVMLCCFTFTLL